MRLDSRVCQDPTAALTTEWLETNGLGGYATSTLAGANTRSYHALLSAALHPPTARTVLLHKLDETVVTPGGGVFELGTNLYHPNTMHPDGYRWLSEFRLDPFPTWVFTLPQVEITKSLFMPHRHNAVVVRYRAVVKSAGKITLVVRPFVNCRDHHHATTANPYFNTAVEAGPGSSRLRMQPYGGLPGLWLAHNGDFVRDGRWHHNYRYPTERERGILDREDSYTPGRLTRELRSGGSMTLIAWTEPHGLPVPEAVERLADELEATELRRRRALVKSCRGWSAPARQLVLGADQFLVSRCGDDPAEAPCESYSVIAGYPWFTDWGRDTLISLPGLTLVTGRFEIARSLLKTFVGYLDQGMLPNVFPETGSTPEYNTVDATLWLFHAVYRYLCYTHDWEFARTLYEPLREVVRWHRAGTRYNIRVMDDGLLRWDAPGVQLTWMDARVGDWVVTPRRGKPVEINALWHNALCLLARLAREFRDPGTRRECEQLARACAQGFEAFWDPRTESLFDVLTDSGPDPAVRPNQVFAACLPFPLLTGARAQSMLAVVARELLTPYGLRSLAPSDPAYRDRYGGDQRSRDGAYHQGTVWSWLLGPYLSAYLQAHGNSPRVRRHVKTLLAPLLAHVQEAGLGGISEVFDGAPPHRANGCPWQAWSAAELLRAWREEGQGHSPPPL